MALSFLKNIADRLGRDKGWQPAVVLDQGRLHGMCYGLDRHGRGRALWENGGRLWTRAFGPGMEDLPSRIPLGDGKDPRIAVNLDGKGAAIWMQRSGFEQRIYGMHLDSGTSRQSSARLLFKSFGRQRDLQVCADRRGNVMLVWSHELEGKWEILSKRFDVRLKAWDLEPVRLGQQSEIHLEPRLAMNRRGQAVVTWHGQAGQDEGLLSAHYLPGTNQWSDHPVLLAPGAARECQAAVDHAGNIMAVWVGQGHRATLQAKLFDAIQASWSDPVVLATAETFQQVRLAMTGTGEALVVWLQSDGSNLTFLYSKAYARGAWAAEVQRLDGEAGRVNDFSMALGPKGLAGLFCLLQNHEACTPIVRHRKKAWGPPAPVGPGSANPYHSPHLSLCPVGSIALWQEGAGSETRLLMSMQR